MNTNKAVLVLEDGSEFEGYAFGAPLSPKGSRDRGYGEVVFNTSMTGYQEILTDPSYYGQMVCMTYPHIGNTGVNAEDAESKALWGAGLIVHELCEEPSNWRANESLDAYLKKSGIPGMHGVDTRALTRHLRSRGVVRGIMLPSSERAHAKALLAELPGFEGRDLIGEVSTREAYRWSKSGPKARTDGSGPFKIVAMDFGVKWNLLRSLEEQGCEIDVVPAKTSAAEILARKPDGVFLSNGPGDPSAAPYAAKTVAEILGQVPIFGVCMGHQILALAVGGKTYKLKFGHRGGNQPVLDRSMDRVEISSHNHGYAVDGNSLPKNVQITHVNLNDKTVEGLAIPEAKAFSVQYHPEACPGPHDSVALFERFVDLMKKK
jgi:carbamoyl-phosphate synthase small subunit